jgi:hypothetical protein
MIQHAKKPRTKRGTESPRPGPDRLSQKTSFWLEERRIAAEAEIERLRAEPNKYGDDEPSKPH